MKYITLIIGLLVMGCGKQEKADTANPVKELTAEEKKVVGEYEMKEGEDTRILARRAVFLDNGIIECYISGKKEEEAKWSISEDGGLHIVDEDGIIDVLRINKDGSITFIATIDKDGKREDTNEVTIQKIK